MLQCNKVDGFIKNLEKNLSVELREIKDNLTFTITSEMYLNYSDSFSEIENGSKLSLERKVLQFNVWILCRGGY